MFPIGVRSLPAGGTLLPAMLSAFQCRSFDNLFTTYDICHTYTLDDKLTASSYISFLPFLVVLTAILNPLKTKRRLFYLKTQFVPRSKHFSSRL